MSDIVKRMREREKILTAISPYDLLLEASDEITRLRSELANARNTALEEAAIVCDEHAKATSSGTSSETEAMRLGARSAAAVIRGLREEGESR